MAFVYLRFRSDIGGGGGCAGVYLHLISLIFFFPHPLFLVLQNLCYLLHG
jgi:hypothetical protein